MWEMLARDVAGATRKLRRSPGFTAAAISILAVGIGGTTALFSVVNAVLLKPLPYAEPGRLVGVWLTAPAWDLEWLNQSPGSYFTFREESRTFEDIGIWDDGRASVVVGEEAEQIPVMRVTEGLFGVLGIDMAFGRRFTPEDDAPGAPRTAILDHDYWLGRLGGDSSVVGTVLTVDGIPTEVIGVAPEGVRVLRYHPGLYLPMQFNRSSASWGDLSYQAIARLRPGITLEQATDDVARMIPLVAEKYPGGMTQQQVENTGIGPHLRWLRDELVGEVSTPLWFLFVATGLVLTIACANVANLLMVQAEGRRREVAVRTALGASRLRIARQLLAESLTLGLLGGGVGVGVALLGVDALRSALPQEFPRLEAIGLDFTGIVFAMGTALAAGLLFGAIPMVRAAGHDTVTGLKEGGRGSGTSRERVTARNGLVAVQVGLALVLVVGSGLMVRSWAALRAMDLGFESPDQVLTFRVNVANGEMSSNEEVAAFYEGVIRELRELPGVVSASGSNNLPMDGYDSNQGLAIEDFPVDPGQNLPSARVKWVAGDYFETLEMPILAGRGITWQDARNQLPVVVVSAAYARLHWGDVDTALGRRIRFGREPWREIVGVVHDVYDDGFDVDPVPTVYWPLLVDNFWGQRPWTPRWFAFALRTPRPDLAGLVAEIRSTTRRVNPSIPVFQVRSMAEIVRLSTLRTDLTLTMLAMAALVALCLATVGIYGVISYSVTRNIREIGVRMALGADAAKVRREVLGKGLAVILVGVALGLAGAVAASRILSSLLFGVGPLDRLTYVLAAAGTLLVATVATYLPAVRASRLDPRSAMLVE